MRTIKKYALYILLGLLYPTVKVIWYIKGLVYLRGVVYGLIAGVITVCIGILALKEYEGAEKSVWHWLAAMAPSIIILLTPIIMIHHLGLRVFLTEKLVIFIVFDGIALVQFGLAVFMFRGLIFKREAGKLELPRVGSTILNTVFRVRKITVKRKRTLREMGIQKGQTVLDYGCGIGRFSTLVAKMVGDDDLVYALDIRPRAIRAVEKEILFATAEHLDPNEFMDIFARGNLFTLVE